MENWKEKLGENVVGNIVRQGFSVLTKKEFDDFERCAKKEKEVPFDLHGPFRVYSIENGGFVVQETSKKLEIVVRYLETMEEIDQFVAQRETELDALWESGCCGGSNLCDAYRPFLKKTN